MQIQENINITYILKNRFTHLLSTSFYVISDNRSFEDYFSKHSITQEDAEMYQYTFLQKVAKSGCIVKSTYILEKIMDARTAEVANLYFCALSISLTLNLQFTYRIN